MSDNNVKAENVKTEMKELTIVQIKTALGDVWAEKLGWLIYSEPEAGTKKQAFDFFSAVLKDDKFVAWSKSRRIVPGSVNPGKHVPGYPTVKKGEKEATFPAFATLYDVIVCNMAVYSAWKAYQDAMEKAYLACGYTAPVREKVVNVESVDYGALSI